MCVQVTTRARTHTHTLARESAPLLFLLHCSAHDLNHVSRFLLLSLSLSVSLSLSLYLVRVRAYLQNTLHQHTERAQGESDVRMPATNKISADVGDTWVSSAETLFVHEYMCMHMCVCECVRVCVGGEGGQEVFVCVCMCVCVSVSARVYVYTIRVGGRTWGFASHSEVTRVQHTVQRQIENRTSRGL